MYSELKRMLRESAEGECGLIVFFTLTAVVVLAMAIGAIGAAVDYAAAEARYYHCTSKYPPGECMAVRD